MTASQPYHPAKQQKILTDPETGSKFWLVTGSHLQFTSFEVPPNSKFAKHSHACEQITYVLDGVLIFEVENKIYKVSAGDCIVIPSHQQHSVWTENSAAKAVDAWSPINEKYLAIKK